MSGFSPLERRALLALISLIRDRARQQDADEDEWLITCIPLRALNERLYVPGPRPYELERRNQRQALRRALGRLHPEFVSALALAWVNLEDEAIWEWQGGGTRQRTADLPGWHRGYRTPRWRMVGLTEAGIKAALSLEQEQ